MFSFYVWIEVFDVKVHEAFVVFVADFLETNLLLRQTNSIDIIRSKIKNTLNFIDKFNERQI